MKEPRKICDTPTLNKQPTTVPLWKYELLREVILRLVPIKAPGVKSKDLPDLIREQLDAASLEKLGSVAWHTTTVKLNMEVEGELQRVEGLRPQHLVRTPTKHSNG